MLELGETLAGRLANIKNTHTRVIQECYEFRLILSPFCSFLKAIAKLTKNDYRHVNLICRSDYLTPLTICSPIRISVSIQDDFIPNLPG